MTSQDVFQRIVAAIEAAGIPYMLTGSFASGHHGAPRASQDIDFVIAPDEGQLKTLVSALPTNEYYVDGDTAIDALRRRSQFNVIDLATGWKIDLIIRKARAFSRQEFDRRTAVEFLGMRLFVATAEDMVVAKLEWSKLGQSQRQIEDVASVVRAQDGLDRNYIDRWVDELGLETQWQDALRVAASVSDPA